MEDDVMDEYDFAINPIGFGYKEFTSDPFHKDAIHSWQKCIYSEDGNVRLYFITINEYMMNFHGEKYHTYEADTQLYQKGTHCALNLEFLHGWTLKSIENQISSIYKNGDFEPYGEA